MTDDTAALVAILRLRAAENRRLASIYVGADATTAKLTAHAEDYEAAADALDRVARERDEARKQHADLYAAHLRLDEYYLGVIDRLRHAVRQAVA